MEGRFVQFHVLTSYPPSNLNRDNAGSPKVGVLGGVPRLRVSSQSLKRAWRVSDVFKGVVVDPTGIRTRKQGEKVFQKFQEKGVGVEDSVIWSREILAKFGSLAEYWKGKKSTLTLTKLKKELKKLEQERKNLLKNGGLDLDDELEGLSKKRKEFLDGCLRLGQLVHFMPEELAGIDELIDKCVDECCAPSKDDLNLLKEKTCAVDIAMFGRMLADSPSFGVEAAVQVSHAIGVMGSVAEDDYWTAVDDLNEGLEDKGAGYIDTRGFGAELFYTYVNVDRKLLKENLGGDAVLAGRAIRGLIESVTMVSPGGMQNSFGSRAYASYVLCERGDEQPRNLSVAFLKPVEGEDVLGDAIKALEKCRERMNKVYGMDGGDACALNANTGEGSLSEVIECATGGLE